MAKLNRRLGLNLTEHDINYVYNCQDSKNLGFYLKTWHGEARLISYLLEFYKVKEGVLLVITGNWHLDKLPCPIFTGRASREDLRFTFP